MENLQKVLNEGYVVVDALNSLTAEYIVDWCSAKHIDSFHRGKEVAYKPDGLSDYTLIKIRSMLSKTVSEIRREYWGEYCGEYCGY